MTKEMTVADIRAEAVEARATLRAGLASILDMSDAELAAQNVTRAQVEQVLAEHDAHDAQIPIRLAQLESRAGKIGVDAQLSACFELAERIAMQAYATGDWDAQARRLTGPRYEAWGIYMRDLKRHADGLGPLPDVPPFPKIAPDFRKSVAHFATELGLTIPPSCLED